MWCNYEQIYPVILMSTLNNSKLWTKWLNVNTCVCVCICVCLVKGRGMKNKASSSTGQSH